MAWLAGDWSHLGEVATKAALMYAAALVALRLGERRTLAQWTLIDFATAVAMGAIIGRTAIGPNSFLTGAVAVATLVVVHRIVSVLRFTAPVAKLVDHRVRVLVEHGRLRMDQLRKCAITESDLFSHLRQRGFFELDGIRYVLYEAKGDITVVPEEVGDARLVASGLHDSAGYP